MIHAFDLNAPSLNLATTDDTSIIQWVDQLLLDAVKKGVSDIHIETYEKIFRIRFRRDGLLYEALTLPLNTAQRIIARVKIMACMDIAERRLPQDGHFSNAFSQKNNLNFRVNACPTLYGEKIVIRILDSSKLNVEIDNLGYEPQQKQLFLDAISQPQGLILVTGPTGSGKTVSLYSALNRINTTEKNICTIEDPVEIYIPGINQVNINPKAGVDFSLILRAFLRQDPNVIMIGEIRDLETADIAMRAAQTGHLVFSTLHTNSAPETLTRLLNMGVATFNIATSITLIIAQRLVRRLCTYCKKPAVIPLKTLEEEGFAKSELHELTLYQANTVGCEYCRQGYAGRIGIFEMLRITPELSEIIMTGGNVIHITTKAIEQGMMTLRHSGLLKVKAGMTSLEELNRVMREIT